MSYLIEGPWINADGTLFEPPENPLKEKWDRLYPPICKDPEELSYSCAFTCFACPKSSSWKIPDEDIEEYNKWKKDYELYCEEHGGFLNIHIPINENWAKENGII